jgi:FSR family fosmidomycin resistance protein-like MFS transporter
LPSEPVKLIADIDPPGEAVGTVIAAPTDIAEPAGVANLPISDQRRVLTAAISSWLLMAVCTLGMSPVYPDIARDLGLRADGFGAVLGVSTLVAGILQIPVGVLSDRFRLKYLAIIGLIAAATAPVVWALSPNYRVFILGQVAMGVCIVCLQASFHTAVAKTFRASGRAAAMSLLFVASSLGGVASLLLFGLGESRFGWRSIALAVAVLPLFAIPFVMRMPDVTAGDAKRTVVEIVTSSFRYLVHGRAIALSALMVLTAAASLATQFMIPFLLRGHSYGAGATGLLLVPFIVGGLVGAPLMGRLADHFGAARPIAVGFVVGAASLGMLSILGPQPLPLVGCFFVLGTLANGGQAVLLASAADLAARLDSVGAGSALGITRLAQSLGPAISPTIIGYLLLHSGDTVTELTIATVFVVCAVLAALILAGLRTGQTASAH